MSYLDLHTHTNRSDGHYDPDTLIQMAEEAGIGIFAITDHNEVAYDLDALQARHPNVKLLYGCEFSAAYVTESGREVELHIVGVDFDPNHPKIRAVLAQNKIDRKPYIDAILAALAKWEISIGTYEELCEKYPETKHLGRKAIGTEMAKQGYVSDVDAAFDLYIGAFGERRAYVKNPARYVDLETCVDAILSAGGTPILAHLSYYQLTPTLPSVLQTEATSPSPGLTSVLPALRGLWPLALPVPPDVRYHNLRHRNSRQDLSPSPDRRAR